MNTPLLSIENLSVTFNHQQKVVDGISFVIYPVKPLPWLASPVQASLSPPCQCCAYCQ